MTTTQPFRIRPASPALSDGPLFLTFVDSQFPYLASIGSAEQWGLKLFSTNPDLVKIYEENVRRSEEQAAKGFSFGRKWARCFIAEKSFEDEGGKEWRAVGAVFLEGKCVDYAEKVLEGEFLYVKFLVTDRGKGRGAGRFLLEYAEEVARGLGLERVCLDCWRGNGAGLVRFYENLGYVWVGDVVEHEGTEEEWPAAVLEKKLR